jgi:hypothetical protein
MACLRMSQKSKWRILKPLHIGEGRWDREDSSLRGQAGNAREQSKHGALGV